MRRWLLPIMAYALFAVSVNAQTQSDSDIWYWAWQAYDMEDIERETDQRGDLIAFLPDGTTNVLLENIFPFALERFDEREATVGILRDDTYFLYHLTSTDAIEIAALYDEAFIEENGWNPIYFGYQSYLPKMRQAGDTGYLFYDTRRDFYLLYDSVSHETTMLPLRAWCDAHCVRVSEDGRYIRYLVSESDQTQRFSVEANMYIWMPNTLPYSIYEFDTETNSERLIHEQPFPTDATPNIDPESMCVPDTFGERWYCELYVSATRASERPPDVNMIVQANGTIEDVNRYWRLRLIDDDWYFLDFDPELTGFDCDPCSIRIYPDGDESQLFTFPLLTDVSVRFHAYTLGMLSENFLLPSSMSSDLMIPSQEGELINIGARNCCLSPISVDWFEPIYYFAVTINTDTSGNVTQIWDARSGNLVATLPESIRPASGGRTFRNHSLVLFDFYGASGAVVAYSHLDNALYEFDDLDRETRRWRYIDAYRGGVLLVDEGSQLHDTRHDLTNDAIYRWTPESGAELLLDGTTLIVR